MRTKLHGVRNCTAPNCTGPYSASLLTGTLQQTKFGSQTRTLPITKPED